MPFFRFSLLVGLFIWSLTIHSAETPTENSATLDNAKFLGLTVIGAKKDDVVNHMWSLGGFTQARSSIRKRGFDRFFSRYRLRDSYFVEFRYNAQKELFSAKRLFRPQSTVYQNRRDAIQTQQVAADLVSRLGQPSRVERKSWGGTPSYNAYVWENENLKVTVDREGSEMLGNVFVLYEVKMDKYLVTAQK